MYEITVAPSLRPPATLLRDLRNINVNIYTQFKHLSRHPGDSTPTLKIKPGQNEILKCGLKICIG